MTTLPEKPGDILQTLLAALGLPADTLWQAETQSVLNFEADCATKQAAALTPASYRPLVDVFGAALTCRFLIGQLPVLTLSQTVSDADFEAFRQSTAGFDTVRLELILNKKLLLTAWFGNRPGVTLHLYLFSQALVKDLKDADLRGLEKDWWGTDSATFVQVMVPALAAPFTTPYLNVTTLAAAQTPAPSLSHDLQLAARSIYDACQNNLRWQEQWISHLTPFHLMTARAEIVDDPIHVALLGHMINLILLYTADRTVSITSVGQKVLNGDYEHSRGKAELRHPQIVDTWTREQRTGVLSLKQLCQWLYENDGAQLVTRLPFVQFSFVDALAAVDVIRRPDALLLRAEMIWEHVQGQWNFYAENQIEAYFAEVQKLEEYVAQTVQGFTDQVSTITEKLSSSVLAAVGALLASFIAALFSDKFKPDIFIVGVSVYIFYLVIFPFGYGMLQQWEKFRVADTTFAWRRQRFEQQLDEPKVAKVIGDRIHWSKVRFVVWYVVSFLVYAAVAIGFAAATLYLPTLLQ